MKQHRRTAVSFVLAILASLPMKSRGPRQNHEDRRNRPSLQGSAAKNYDACKAYRGVLGFGGAPQTMNVVDNVIARNFRDGAEKRGYIVVVPAAPDGQLFFEGGERIFPEFLKQLPADYRIQDNKFHIAGPSNGGIAAFHVASCRSLRFQGIREETPAPSRPSPKCASSQYVRRRAGSGCLTVLGVQHLVIPKAALPLLYMPAPLKGMSGSRFGNALLIANKVRAARVGRQCFTPEIVKHPLDPMGWQDSMRKQASDFRARGMTAQYTVEKGQPHRLETVAGPNAGRLFDLVEQARQGCGK